MRRPPPLPAPDTAGGTGGRKAGDRARESARENARRGILSSDDSLTTPSAPASSPSHETWGDESSDGWSAPLLAADRSALAGVAAPVGPETSADASADVSRPTRLRDVWRAARARRRALRREVRRFTVRSRRRRIAWLGGTAAVLLLVVASVGAAYSPLFAVENIEVVGTRSLPADTIEQSLSDQMGTPLPLVDASAVKAALVAFPLVESYTLEARPPHDLVVRIVERTPIGVIQTEAGWTLVDAAGVALETTETPPDGRPVLEIAGGVDSAAFESVGLVMRALPDDIGSQVTRVTAATRDDVTLTLASGTQVVWGSVDDTALKAVNLATAMASLPGMSVYDVSSAGSVVVR